jgi:hypothetical protein
VILDALALRRRLFGGFAFIGSLSTLAQFSFRFMALRHQVFPDFAFYRSNYIIARFESKFNHSFVLFYGVAHK